MPLMMPERSQGSRDLFEVRTAIHSFGRLALEYERLRTPEYDSVSIFSLPGVHDRLQILAWEFPRRDILRSIPLERIFYSASLVHFYRKRNNNAREVQYMKRPRRNPEAFHLH